MSFGFARMVDPAMHAQEHELGTGLGKGTDQSADALSAAGSSQAADAAFLRGLVSRLSAELARARSAAAPAAAASTGSSVTAQGCGTPSLQASAAATAEQRARLLHDLLASGDAIWLWDATTLTPLLAAYDSALADARSKLTELQSKVPALVSKCETVVQENSALHDRIGHLSNSVKKPGIVISPVAESDGSPVGTYNCVSPQSHQPNASTMDTNDSTARVIMAQNQQLRKALHNARAEGDKRQIRLRVLEDAAPRMQRRCEEAEERCSLMAKEIAEVRKQYSDLHEHKRVSDEQACKVNAEYSDVVQQLRDRESALDALSKRFREVVMDMRAAVVRHRELAGLLTHRQQLIAAVRRLMRHQNLMATALATAKADGASCVDLQAKLDTATAELAGVRRALADAIAERDQAVASLDTAYSGTLSKQEAAALQEAAEAAAAAALSERNLLLERQVETSHRAERAERDLGAANEALRRHQTAAQAELARAKGTVETLQASVRTETHARAEAELRLSQLQNKINEDSTLWEQERRVLTEESTQLQRQNSRLEAALEAIKDDHRKVLLRLEAANQAHHDATVALDDCKRNSASTETQLTRRLESRIRALEEELANARLAHRARASSGNAFGLRLGSFRANCTVCCKKQSRGEPRYLPCTCPSTGSPSEVIRTVGCGSIMP